MLTFNDNKAGMAGLDKEKITKIIEENSSTSFTNFTKKQMQRIQEKSEEITRKIKTASKFEKDKAIDQISRLEIELEQHRDLSRDCVCIDMDAYFASVEMRDDACLRTIPMAVGSQSMLSTSNYIARRFGVRAAMPGFIAKKLCPSLRIVPGNYQKYTKVSREFASIFAEYDPDMNMMSLDEAYIDLTEYVSDRHENKKFERRRFGGECICRLPRINQKDGLENLKTVEKQCEKCQKTEMIYSDYVEFGTSRAEIVREIRFRVEQLTGLTCSAGIAANFMLAKICSDFNKPNGQFELENRKEIIMDFLKNLPIRKVCGIGRVSEAHLNACEINSVGDILEKKQLLPLVFSSLSQESFMRVALGLPSRPSSTDSKRKSVSIERTFSSTSDFAILCSEHEEICRILEEDVRKIGIVGGKTITIKLKLSSFDVLTRSLTPGNLICTLEDIRKFSRELLEREKGQEIRLLGVRLSQLVFNDDNERSKSNVKTITEFWNENKPENTENTIEIINMLPCPICDVKLENKIEVVNRHVDECIRAAYLNDEAVPELICISMNTNKAKSETKKFGAKRKKPKIVTMDAFLKRKT